MWLLYMVVNDFGWAVVLFTLIVKAASFPLTLKQQKNQAVSQLFTPRVQEIQRKYRGNQAKMQEEMQKLQKEGYSPMGGCGPMLLTMVILFGVIDVVYKPITHMERFDKTGIEEVVNISKQVEYTSIILENEEVLTVFLEHREISAPAAPQNSETSKVSNDQRKEIGEFIFDNMTTFTGNDSPLSPEIRRALNSANNGYVSLRRELRAVSQYSLSPEAFASLSTEYRNKLENLNENLVFLGFMNLGAIPQLGRFDGLWLIAFLCFALSVVQMQVQKNIQKRTMPDMPNMGAMKFMFIMGPAFSLIIVFTVPAGAGLYWAVSYMFMLAQSIFIFKRWPPEKMREEAKAKLQARGGTIDITARVTDIDAAGNEVVTETKLSEMSKREQEEYFKKKLEAARKEDLEKYGDESQLSIDNNNEGDK